MAKNLTVLVFVFLENKWSKQFWTLENFYKLDQLRRNSNTVVAAVGVPVVAVVVVVAAPADVVVVGGGAAGIVVVVVIDVCPLLEILATHCSVEKAKSFEINQNKTSILNEKLGLGHSWDLSYKPVANSGFQICYELRGKFLLSCSGLWSAIVSLIRASRLHLQWLRSELQFLP